MDLNNITTQVRPRNKWQALDLGFKMASQWYLELFKGYLAIGLPLFIIINLVFFEMPIVALILIWWLKPINESIQLGFLSHAMFGQQLTLKQQIALLLKIPKTEWLAAIGIQRISLRRSYYRPIRQLENQKGQRFTKRKTAFNGQNNKAAFWLTFVLVHLESMIVFALILLANYLIPEQTGFSFDVLNIDEDSSSSTIYNNALVFISYSLIAPFYTCAGFSLYLNQRTQIEGWDIEISFKRLIARTQANHKNIAKSTTKSSTNSSTTAAKSLLIVMLIGCLSSFSDPLMAADNQISNADNSPNNPAQTEKQQAYDQIQAIIKSDTFNKKITRSYPEAFLNLKTDDDKSDSKVQFGLPEWLHSLLRMFSFSIEWLLTLFVLTILVLFCVRYRHWFNQFLPENVQQPQHSKYQQLFGVALPEQNLIENIQQQATTLCQAKQKREALSLLYRASLQVLVNQEHIKVNDAFTEGECVRQVKQNASKTISQYFKSLTQNWQRLAYANKEPDDPTLAKLIEQWSQIFVTTTQAPSEPNNKADTKAQGGRQ